MTSSTEMNNRLSMVAAMLEDNTLKYLIATDEKRIQAQYDDTVRTAADAWFTLMTFALVELTERNEQAEEGEA